MTKKKEKNCENSGPLTSLPVGRLPTARAKTSNYFSPFWQELTTTTTVESGLYIFLLDLISKDLWSKKIMANLCPSLWTVRNIDTMLHHIISFLFTITQGYTS